MNFSIPQTTTSRRACASRRTLARSSLRRSLRGRPALWVALAAALCAAPIAAKTLKIATTSPSGSSWVKALNAANEELRAATGDALALKVYAGGTKGEDDTVVLRKIRIGELHGALMTAAVFQRIYPDVQIYNLPMAFRSLAEVDAVRERMDPLLLAGLSDAGFEAFGIAELGMAYPMSIKPARTVADARRLKVWSPAGDMAAARTLEAFGISPVSLTIADVYSGLSSGLLDAVAVPPVAAVPLLWHTRLKYVLDLPIMYIYGTFVVDKRALRGVPEKDVETMRRIMSAAVAESDRRNRDDHEKVLQVLRNSGLEFVTLNAEELAEWREFGKAAARKWVEEGVLGTEIHKAFTDLLAEMRAQAR